ncbi:MAG: dienelactone hydrolase family protein [Hyphomicrobiaceae bacterium]
MKSNYTIPSPILSPSLALGIVSIHATAVPLLILIGRRDTWTPAGNCESLAKRTPDPYSKNIRLKVYDRAYHTFDAVGLKVIKNRYGHRAGNNHAAFADSLKRTKAFLQQYLKRR